MLTALRAEFRKLFTVRSTYFITAFVVALVIFIAFYLEGWRLTSADLSNPFQLAESVTGALNITVFGAIVAIMLMTHEYRYNTIMYTLTATNNRSKVLFGKFVTVSAYALFLAALIAVLSPLMVYLGVKAHGHTLAPQILYYHSLAWRSLFYGWGYAMAGLLIAVIARSQVAAIVALFVIPSIVEQLLSFYLLKHNSVYLPFSSLSQVINGNNGGPTGSTLSAGHAAGVFCIYLVVGWIIAWVLFLKRDAN